MDITIKINTDNAAFDRGNARHEVARILRKVAQVAEDDGTRALDDLRLMDINGNRVGLVTIE